MTEHNWSKASDEEIEQRVKDWKGPFEQPSWGFLYQLARRYLAQREEIKRLQEEKDLTFDSMVDHHETETTELQQTIDSHEAAMWRAIGLLIGFLNLPRVEGKIARAAEILRAELEKK